MTYRSLYSLFESAWIYYLVCRVRLSDALSGVVNCKKQMSQKTLWPLVTKVLVWPDLLLLRSIVRCHVALKSRCPGFHRKCTICSVERYSQDAHIHKELACRRSRFLTVVLWLVVLCVYWRTDTHVLVFHVAKSMSEWLILSVFSRGAKLMVNRAVFPNSWSYPVRNSVAPTSDRRSCFGISISGCSLSSSIVLVYPNSPRTRLTTSSFKFDLFGEWEYHILWLEQVFWPFWRAHQKQIRGSMIPAGLISYTKPHVYSFSVRHLLFFMQFTNMQVILADLWDCYWNWLSFNLQVYCDTLDPNASFFNRHDGQNSKMFA